MVEPRCPECSSRWVSVDEETVTGQWRCESCGERFDFECALISLREAEDFRSAMEAEPIFCFHRVLARVEMRLADGPLRALSPYSDAEELHRALDAAIARRVIEARRSGAALHAYVIPGADLHPVLGVDPGVGAELVGPRLAMEQEPGEDPITYTVRWLEKIVESANALLAGRLHAASGTRPEIDLDPGGPRSQRRYVAVAYWLGADSSIGETFRAEGTSIRRVLFDVGGQIEAGDFNPEHFLNLAVLWRDEAGADEEGQTAID